jgi:AcrR family transcriptional regulator
MARPTEFDEGTVLDAAVLCFWKQGYEATSVRDLVAQTGITAASLYNAFGDERACIRRRWITTSKRASPTESGAVSRCRVARRSRHSLRTS